MYKGAPERLTRWVLIHEQPERLLLEHKAQIDIAWAADEIAKLRSMCKAAANEIDKHWDAHCNEHGYGPSNLVDRLSGKLKPDLYPGFDI